MSGTLLLAQPLREEFERQARDAWPRECCGLIEGVTDGDLIRATALHAARNLSQGTDRFEIDPAEHIRLSRTLRETDRVIVGCYHSHPDGEARPSPRDCDGAVEAGFIWLIAGLRMGGDMRLAAFIASEKGFAPLELRLA